MIRNFVSFICDQLLCTTVQKTQPAVHTSEPINFNDVVSALRRRNFVQVSFFLSFFFICP